MIAVHVARQLAGTLPEQLAHLRQVSAMPPVGVDAAPVGSGHTQRGRSQARVLAWLSQCAREVVAGEIEQELGLSKFSVNRALRNLEWAGKVAHRNGARPSGGGGVAFLWKVRNG